MGRKNQIEGQLNFWELLGAEEAPTVAEEVPVAGNFKECAACWCATCEHSTMGGGVPRPFGEVMRACPSCELCIKEGKADVCVIGSAEEGCRYRAEKEGLVE